MDDLEKFNWIRYMETTTVNKQRVNATEILLNLNVEKFITDCVYTSLDNALTWMHRSILLDNWLAVKLLNVSWTQHDYYY